MTPSATYQIAQQLVQLQGSFYTNYFSHLKEFDRFRILPGPQKVTGVCATDFNDDQIKCDLYDSRHVLHQFEVESTIHEYAVSGNWRFFSMIPFDASAPRLIMRFRPEDGLVRCNTHDFPLPISHFAFWMAVNVLLCPQQVLAIHSSTIQCQGKAILFLGESGTGKSTHTRLWLKHIPQSHLLNDDSPFLRIDRSQVMAHGSPWSGKTPCYLNESFPVCAFVRLSQAPYNRIHPLSTMEAISALLPSFSPFFRFDEILRPHLLQLLSDILTRVPVYHLECLPDCAAAELAYQTVMQP